MIMRSQHHYKRSNGVKSRLLSTELKRLRKFNATVLIIEVLTWKCIDLTKKGLNFMLNITANPGDQEPPQEVPPGYPPESPPTVIPPDLPTERPQEEPQQNPPEIPPGQIPEIPQENPPEF